MINQGVSDHLEGSLETFCCCWKHQSALFFLEESLYLYAFLDFMSLRDICFWTYIKCIAFFKFDFKRLYSEKSFRLTISQPFHVFYFANHKRLNYSEMWEQNYITFCRINFLVFSSGPCTTFMFSSMIVGEINPSQEAYYNSINPLVKRVPPHIPRPPSARWRPVNMWGHPFY